MHPQAVAGPRQRDQGGAQIINSVVHPLRSLDDSPPALIFGWNQFLQRFLQDGKAGTGGYVRVLPARMFSLTVRTMIAARVRCVLPCQCSSARTPRSRRVIASSRLRRLFFWVQGKVLNQGDVIVAKTNIVVFAFRDSSPLLFPHPNQRAC